MKQLGKKKLVVDTQTIRQLSTESIRQVAGGFVSYGTCVSELARCPK